MDVIMYSMRFLVQKNNALYYKSIFFIYIFLKKNFQAVSNSQQWNTFDLINNSTCSYNVKKSSYNVKKKKKIMVNTNNMIQRNVHLTQSQSINTWYNEAYMWLSKII